MLRSRLFWRLFLTHLLLGLGVWFLCQPLTPSHRQPIVLGILGVAALLLAGWLTRRVRGPVQELTDAARHIAAGGYGHRIYPPRGDEVADLATTFNEMSERL